MRMSEWIIDEDPETLSATLSLVASWDTKDQARSSSSSEEVPEEQAPVELATRVKAKPGVTRHRRVNATRERRKEEIELLRNESAQLVSELIALQERREAMLRPHFSGNAIRSTAPVWENMARRQFQTRRRAEEFNARLRGQLADQVQVAEGLMNAIQVAMQRQTLQQTIRRPVLAIDVSQQISEEEQLQRLQFLLDQWQWALSLSPRFPRGELQFSDFVLVESDEQSATLDAYNSYVLPYSVERVADLVWSNFHEETSGFEEGDGDDVDKYVQEHTTRDELIIAVYNSDSTMGGATARQGTISGKWVAKQTHLDDGDQRLLATHWHYELAGFENELDGMSVSSDSWVRFVDAKDIGCTQFTEPVAVLQHVRRLQINFNRSEGVDERHVKTVTDLLSKEVDSELEYVQRNLEDTLMAQNVRPKLT